MHTLFFLLDGYTVRDVVMYWTPTPVIGVEDAELPQFSIIKYETKDRMEKLATGNSYFFFIYIQLYLYFIFYLWYPHGFLIVQKKNWNIHNVSCKTFIRLLADYIPLS